MCRSRLQSPRCGVIRRLGNLIPFRFKGKGVFKVLRKYTRERGPWAGSEWGPPGGLGAEVPRPAPLSSSENQTRETFCTIGDTAWQLKTRSRTGAAVGRVSTRARKRRGIEQCRERLSKVQSVDQRMRLGMPCRLSYGTGSLRGWSADSSASRAKKTCFAPWGGVNWPSHSGAAAWSASGSTDGARLT